MKPKFASFNAFKQDLEALEKVFQVRRFRFCGGEPLLHPNILSFIRQVRQSRIATEIEIVSNGSIFHKIDEAVLRDIDMVTISWYPDSRFNQSKYSLARKKCKKYNIILKVHRADQFRVTQLDSPNENSVLTDQIYSSCQIANFWYAQTFYDGRFYLCSRPLFLNAYLKHKGKSPQEFKTTDGVSLHEDQLFQRLVAYLQRDKHLGSCQYCLGTVGKTVPWRQLSRDERRSAHPIDRNPSEMVNLQKMNCLLKWTKVKNKILKVIPSLQVSRILDLLIEASIRYYPNTLK